MTFLPLPIHRRGTAARVILPALMLALCCVAAHAEDWPQFLGPNRNGAAVGDLIAKTFPKEGPAKVWQKKVGQGFQQPHCS